MIEAEWPRRGTRLGAEHESATPPAADGLHHLRYSDLHEQMLKIHFLPLALEVIRKAGTVQEYRRIWQPFGAARADGVLEGKDVEYWGFVAIIRPRPDKNPWCLAILPPAGSWSRGRLSRARIGTLSGGPSRQFSSPGGFLTLERGAA